MKYLFFDIECACVYKSVAKICAFGYVVTDENFREIEREDILINPKGKFHLTDRKGGQGLVLPYEYEDFKKYPLFPEVYLRIKRLFDEADFICGHATRNDVNYLNLETKRYKLPSFSFPFHDTQFFYMNSQNSFSQQYGLGAIATELGVEFTPHRAVDDAYATMRVLWAICEREGVDVPSLIKKYAVRPGRAKNGGITLPTSAGSARYYAEREAEKAARAKAHEQFFRYVNKNMNKRKKGGLLDGKVFCFDREIENDLPLSRKLAEAIFASGGTYTSHPAECNVYIACGAGGVRCQNAVTAGAAVLSVESLQSALQG